MTHLLLIGKQNPAQKGPQEECALEDDKRVGFKAAAKRFSSTLSRPKIAVF